MQNKFQLNDIVYGKKTGNLVKARIEGVFTYQISSALMKGTVEKTDEYWSSIYPEWKDKPVYMCIFEFPQKNFSYEEMINDLRTNYEHLSDFMRILIDTNNETLLKAYYSSVPEVHQAQYPEDDLQLWGEF